jgi:hypothetical protein
MLIEVGILLSAYIGMRLVEKRREALTLKKKNVVTNLSLLIS